MSKRKTPVARQILAALNRTTRSAYVYLPGSIALVFMRVMAELKPLPVERRGGWGGGVHTLGWLPDSACVHVVLVLNIYQELCNKSLF